MFSFRKFVGVRKFSSPGVPFWRFRLLAQWTMYMYSGIATGRLRWGCLSVGRGGRGVCSWVDHFPGGFLTTGEYQSWKYSKGTPFPLWMFMVPPPRKSLFPTCLAPFSIFAMPLFDVVAICLSASIETVASILTQGHPALLKFIHSQVWLKFSSIQYTAQLYILFAP